MIAKKLQKQLADTLKKFQKSRFEEVSAMMKELNANREELDKGSLAEILKFHSLFFWVNCWVIRRCTRSW
jgi:hypothetical protein